MIDDPNRPAWAGNFFVGMPAPAGAITVLLPIYVYFLGMPRLAFVAPVTLLYTLAIAFLMVSRLPVFSGKRVGKRVAPEMVLPVFVAGGAVLRAADRLSVVGADHRHGGLSRQPAVRLALLSRAPAQGRGRRRADGQAGRDAAAPVERESPSLSPGSPGPDQPGDPDRPTRLN